MSSERPAPGRVPFVSGPIQILPAGLLGFLQLKSPAGRNPEVMNGDVQPTVDMLPFYLNQQAIHATQGGRTVGAGSSGGFFAFDAPSIVVPLDEWWYCHHFTVQVEPVAAGDTYQGFAPMAFLDPNAPSARAHLLAQPIYGRPTGGKPASAAHNFWLPPGSQLGWFIDFYNTTTADGIVGDLFFSRLPI